MRVSMTVDNSSNNNIPWNKGKLLSKSHKDKIGSRNKGRRGTFEGQHLSSTHRRNVSIALTGRKLSPEHIKNVSIGVKKWWSKPENREFMRARQLGTRRFRQHSNISK
jgi:hypothetical protein